MNRFKKIFKWTLLSLLGLALLLFTFGYWFLNLIPRPDADTDIPKTRTQSLPYVSKNQIASRGRILAVVTSTETMGENGKTTGYELTELSRAYYVFLANGFEVDVASPKGGQPPVVIDDEDMGVYDFAFLNDPVAQQKTKNSLAMDQVDSSLYDAIYFVGGKGAMFDFPNNLHIQSIVRSYYLSGKVIGAVCHGPAALVNIKLANDLPLIKDKRVCSFTNKEELFLIPEAETIFPFLLEDQLVKSGAHFEEGTMYLENVVHDQKLITGQNPWSTWRVAETMIEEMGYQPKNRVLTPEENTIDVLGSYQEQGYESAKKMISEMAVNQVKINRTLLAMHGIVAAMQWNLGASIELVVLLKHAKDKFEDMEN